MDILAEPRAAWQLAESGSNGLAMGTKGGILDARRLIIDHVEMAFSQYGTIDA